MGQPAYTEEYRKKLEEEERKRAALQKRLQAEAEREAAKEEERRIREWTAEKRRQYAELCRSQWAEFQKVKHKAPPTLLPLEMIAERASFDAFLGQHGARHLWEDRLFQEERAAFKSELDRFTRESRRAMKSFETQLGSAWPLHALIGRLRFGQHVDILRGCLVSSEVPDIGSPSRENMIDQCRLLRRKWSEHLDPKDQTVFSVRRFGDRTVVHIGSSVHGSVFVTVPHSMDPETAAAALLSHIAHSAGKLIPNDKTIAIIDGDHQTVNLQRVFPNNVVVRTSKDDCPAFVANLNTVCGREAPSPENTAVHFGVPSNEAELKSVFSSGADWSLWSDVSNLWRKRASRNGFANPASASASEVLSSLGTDKNVIIVIAHADGQSIFMPAPPPEGSRLSADQVLERKREISANKPVVYLFCCETAAISNLKNFSQSLLDAGVAAVVAPQTKIDARRSADFFDALVKRERTAVDMLGNLRKATRRSKYREMEVWLG